MIKSLGQEPWVELDSIKELQNWTTENLIQWNQNNRVSEKYRCYINTFDFLASNQVQGDYLEFGCHRARTFRMALTEAKRQGLDKMRFLAFDSFRGLPSVDTISGVSQWGAGNLMTSEKQFMDLINNHGIYLDAIQIYPGYFKDSLNDKLKTKLMNQKIQASFICVDCDLYESAIPVFNFLEGFLQEGTILYLDDVFAGYKGSPIKGVKRAFNEFLLKSKYKFEKILSVAWFGEAYVAYTEGV